jgi:2-phosphosulfolactate phosphatase
MTRVHVEWGASGAATLAARYPVVVVCDVLSFSTTVSVATSRGVRVFPHAWRDESAAARAASIGAVLAGPRGDDVSLSPSTMHRLSPGTSIVLPSPNGATCCVAAAAAGAQVTAGCLRNATAVAQWCLSRDVDVGIVAAGERWPDESLRPAYEDWVGAGAIVALMREDAELSPEADAAAAAALTRRPFAEVASGVELIAANYPDDVTMAEVVDADAVVPLLVDGAFVDAG